MQAQHRARADDERLLKRAGPRLAGDAEVERVGDRGFADAQGQGAQEARVLFVWARVREGGREAVGGAGVGLV